MPKPDQSLGTNSVIGIVSTPTRIQIEWWIRATKNLCTITNRLDIDEMELNRLIGEYWPEIPERKRNVTNLRKFLRPRLWCTIHIEPVQDTALPHEQEFTLADVIDRDGFSVYYRNSSVGYTSL